MRKRHKYIICKFKLIFKNNGKNIFEDLKKKVVKEKTLECNKNYFARCSTVWWDIKRCL